MRPSNPKFSFGPGFSVAKKILSLVVLFCFLVFFSLVYAGGLGNPEDPVGEHPWDELNNKPIKQSPQPPEITNVLIFPCDSFGRWIIIHSPQVKNGNIEKGQIQSSDKNQGKVFIFF
jgi:hypothetical protein